jgi:ferredoxin
MRVTVDQNLCIGSGNCVRIADDLFTQDDEDALVVLLVEHPAEDRQAAARQAVATCPTGAITVADDDAG